ncbi:hypothetical protein [Speluncibacter jeojiensis]|uniref:Uncharacterized protein n=1 Tax=Speluncibacter jeojiensis TaxID=2710754 RepID=A0A9X4LZU5_9ACTN|nr:hypothetical protein [Corynebacteriales bacterium D3-21]
MSTTDFIQWELERRLFPDTDPRGITEIHAWGSKEPVRTIVDRGEFTSWPQWPTEADQEVVHDEDPTPAHSTNWLDILRGFTAGASMGVVVGLGLWWTEIHG